MATFNIRPFDVNAVTPAPRKTVTPYNPYIEIVDGFEEHEFTLSGVNGYYNIAEGSTFDTANQVHACDYRTWVVTSVLSSDLVPLRPGQRALVSNSGFAEVVTVTAVCIFHL